MSENVCATAPWTARHGVLDDELGGWSWNRVQTVFGFTVQQGCSRGEILDKERRRMEFKKTIVIVGKFIGRDKIFTNVRSMENIFQMQRMAWTRYESFTNM
jgi:hypothetical protein